MKDIHFPLFKTKMDSTSSPQADTARRFNLNDPEERRVYFTEKAGPEIEKLQKFVNDNTFIGYLLGKKNSGKGTYSKLFMDAVSREKVGHVSVGDIVRGVHEALSDETERKNLVEFLEKHYRGFHTIEETIDLIKSRSTEKLLSSELILALLEYEVSRRPRQSIFVDGFPRGMDQIGYALYLKKLLGFRNDPDFFIFINVPESVIDERIKYRVICPLCKTPRSIKLLATKEVGWDEESRTFYLKCDTPECHGERMVAKEGDELGIGPIRERLETDDQIFKLLMGLQGVPKVYLRNSIPVAEASKYVDEYELTPEYVYTRDAATGKIAISEKPWIINDDDGVPSYSLLPPAIVVSLIKQVAQVLGL
jgi:adenylate kinase family enzyme